MPNTNASQARTSRVLTLVATLLVVVTLYLARVVLVPIALAVLLCFLLAPVVTRLQRLGVHRVPAVIVVTITALGAVAAVGYVVSVEVISLADSLPQYRANIRQKARALAGPGLLSRASESIRSVTEDAIKATTQPDAGETRPAATRPQHTPGAPVSAERAAAATPPTRVEVVEPPETPMHALVTAVTPALGPLGTAGIVIVFVIFMLIQREDLRDRMIALTGSTQINMATQAIDDAAQRVSRYLLMQFVVNVTYGIPVAIGLMFLGVPNAPLWGILCVVFRYIPYVGPWLGAALPTFLALAVFDDWTRPLMVVGLFVVLELLSNNIIEPWLYGSGTGVSPMAVLVSAVFWGWLWGVPGLVLATPLTVCLVVLGRYLPQMQWLAVLLGDQPSLPLPARIYQRLLALDHDEAMDLAHDYLKSHTLLECYEHVLIPALILAETDRHEGQLEPARSDALHAGVRELIEELGENSGDGQAPAPNADARAPEAGARRAAVIVAARDEADELAGQMLAQLLRREGIVSTVLAPGLAAEVTERVADIQQPLVCVSAMPPMAVTHARYICKRLTDRLPQSRLVVGLWSASDPQRATERMQSSGADIIVTSLAQALEKMRM